MPKFTDRYLASLTLKPGQKDRMVFDTECKSLGARLTAKGSIYFLAQWTDRATGLKPRQQLGRWGDITIDQGRIASRAILGDVAKGKDPAADRAAKKTAAAAEKADAALTFVALVEQWEERHLVNRRPRYAAEAARALRYAFADQMAKPASKLTRAMILDVLDRLDSAGKSTMAQQTLAYGRAAYGWALKREKVKTNPFVGLPAVGRQVDRDRTLSEQEIADVWAAAGALPYPFGPFYRLALLTMQRREEVAGACWSEFSDDLTMWRIPGARMKNGKAHDIALPELARELLRALPRHAARGGKDGALCDLVFTTNLTTPVSGFSKAKIDLDTALLAHRGGKVGAPFRLHDFRRSGASWMASAGFDTIVIDKILAHQPAKLRGVAAVYQRHSYAEERKRALEAWGAQVLGQSTGSVVLPFRRS